MLYYIYENICLNFGGFWNPKIVNFRANLVEFMVEKGHFLFVPQWYINILRLIGLNMVDIDAKAFSFTSIQIYL